MSVVFVSISVTIGGPGDGIGSSVSWVAYHSGSIHCSTIQRPHSGLRASAGGVAGLGAESLASVGSDVTAGDAVVGGTLSGTCAGGSCTGVSLGGAKTSVSGMGLSPGFAPVVKSYPHSSQNNASARVSVEQIGQAFTNFTPGCNGVTVAMRPIGVPQVSQ